MVKSHPVSKSFSTETADVAHVAFTLTFKKCVWNDVLFQIWSQTNQYWVSHNPGVFWSFYDAPIIWDFKATVKYFSILYILLTHATRSG